MTADKYYCSRCGDNQETFVTLLPEGKHYAKRNCCRCGGYIAFVKKPENEKKRSKNKFTASDMGIDFCQLCLRQITRLGDRGVLEVHHVEEIHNGGEDTKDNAWVVCSSCHRLIHHQRTYLNEHTKNMVSEKDILAMADEHNVTGEIREALLRVFRKHEALNNRKCSEPTTQE